MKINFTSFKIKYILLLLIPTLFVLAYWFKFQIGIDFFDSFSISSYFPFKYFTSDVIVLQEPGIILEENFNKKRIIKTWTNLWMREDGTVSKELSSDGINGSKCLLIKNTSKGSWSYSHNKKVLVKKGDVFYFEGDVNIEGEDCSAYLCVAAFDKNKNVINWNLFKEKVNRTGVWLRVEKQFNISDDIINYITFRLIGSGNGNYRFDNITFRKIK